MEGKEAKAKTAGKNTRKRKDPPKRFRLAVPCHDLDVLEWAGAQENLSLSLRVLIQDYVNRFGPTDAMMNGVGRIRSLYGARPKGAKGSKDVTPYVPVEARLQAKGAADMGPAGAAHQAPAAAGEVPGTSAVPAPEPIPAPVPAPVPGPDPGDAFDPMAGITLPDYSSAPAVSGGSAEDLVNSII